MPKFWVSIHSYKKQPVKKIWGRILGLAWLKFAVAALNNIHSAEMTEIQSYSILFSLITLNLDALILAGQKTHYVESLCASYNLQFNKNLIIFNNVALLLHLRKSRWHQNSTRICTLVLVNISGGFFRDYSK